MASRQSSTSGAEPAQSKTETVMRPKFGLQPLENRCGRDLRNASSDGRANPANLARRAMHGTNGRTAVQSAPAPVESPRVYFDDDFRDRMVTRVTDPMVARFWREGVRRYEREEAAVQIGG
jgi:hypothetical protein